jgi:hypothetical protein
MATSKKRNPLSRFGDAVNERVQGLSKAREEYINKQETARVAAGQDAQDKINNAAADKADPVIKNPTDPKPVIDLREAKPTVTPIPDSKKNPRYRPSTTGNVEPGSINDLRAQEIARDKKQRDVKKIPKKKQDPKPDFKFETAPGASPAVERGADGLNKDIFTGTNASTQYIDAKGNVLSAAQYHTQQNMDKAKTILADTKSGKYTPEVIKNAAEFVKTGGVSEFLGEQAGVQAKSASAGLNKSVPYSSDAAAIAAEAPLKTSTGATPDDIVLKGASENVGLGQAKGETFQNQAESFVETEQPKASRTIKERAADAFNAAKEKVGLGQASDTPDVPGNPEPPKTSRTKAVVKGVSGAGAVVEGADLAAKYINNLSDVGFDEANQIAKQGILDTVTEASAGLGRQATRIDQGKFGEAADAAGDFALDSLKGLAKLPGSIYDQGGRAGYNLRNALGFGVPESGIYRADPNDPRKVLQGQTTDQTSQESLDDVNAGRVDDLTKFDRDNSSQDLIDQSFADSERGSSSPPPVTDLRTGARENGSTSYVPPGQNQDRRQITDEQYLTNNLRANEIGADQTPGTGFMQSRGPDGNFETFIDGRGQPEPAPQERGLGAARNEIDGRGRFSDNPRSNLLGEFALSRQTADENKVGAVNARTAATLRGQNTTANTAARKANEDRFNKIDDELGSGDPTRIRNAMTGVYGRFQNAVNQGNYDPNSADAMQASNIITRNAVDAADIGLPEGIWNSLMPRFLAGGGRGALDFLNGELSINGSVPYEGLKFGEDGTLKAKSSDPATGWIDLGYIEDADTANFMRQILSVRGQ